MTRTARATVDETGHGLLPDEYGWACLLLLLHEQPRAEPELEDGLRELGLADEAGLVGSGLHELEFVGLVRATGPDDDEAARIYALTPDGTGTLALASAQLRGTRDLLGWFVARCRERTLDRAAMAPHESAEPTSIGSTRRQGPAALR